MNWLITGSRVASKEMLSMARAVVIQAKELGHSIIVGDAPGVDAEVIRVCDDLGVPVEVHGAYSKLRNRTKTGENIIHPCDYPGRDRIMASKADEVWAIWNGTSHGTCITFKHAQKLGKPVHILKPQGAHHELA